MISPALATMGEGGWGWAGFVASGQVLAEKTTNATAGGGRSSASALRCCFSPRLHLFDDNSVQVFDVVHG